MKKIGLLTFLSLMLLVFTCSFDTFAAGGGWSFDDPMEIQEGTVIERTSSARCYKYTAKVSAGYKIEFKRRDSGKTQYKYRCYLNDNNNSYSTGFASGGNPSFVVYLNAGEIFKLEFQSDATDFEAEVSISNVDESDFVNVSVYDESGSYTWDKEKGILNLDNIDAHSISIDTIPNAPLYEVEVNIKGDNYIRSTGSSYAFRASNVNIKFTGDGVLNVPYNSKALGIIDIFGGSCIIDGPTFILESNIEPITLYTLRYGYDGKDLVEEYPEYLNVNYNFILKSGTIDVTLHESERYNYAKKEDEHCYPRSAIIASGNIDITGGIVKVRFNEETEAENPLPTKAVALSHFRNVNISGAIIAVDHNDKRNLPLAIASVGKANVASDVIKLNKCDFKVFTKADFSLEFSEIVETGNEIKPAVKSKSTLVEGKDFTVEYKDNIKVGKASVVITGIGDYVGSITLEFTIKENLSKKETKTDSQLSSTTEQKTSEQKKVNGVGTFSSDGKTLIDENGIKYKVSEKVTSKELKKNLKIADKKSGGKYKIIKLVKNKKTGKITSGMVEYVAPYNKNCKTISATGKVKLAGVTFTVARLGNNCAKGCKKLTKVVIGENITTIGKNAFSGCNKLKSITVKSKKLKKVGIGAFKGINKKATIKVPKSKCALYKKLFKGKGQAKTVKIK